MRILTTLLNILAGALFVASLVFAFLGADSVERPGTRQLLSGSMICLIAGVVFLLIRVSIAIAQRRRTDA